MTKRERVMTALRGGEVDRVGPDCSINPDTPEALLHAVGAAVRNTSRQVLTRSST